MTETAQKRPRKRPALTAERIAAEAMAMVDLGGYEALSFRGLAKRLNCEAMSLYHYFPSKAHLTDALVNICLSEIVVPPPGPDWRARLRSMCLSYRDAALRHPGFVPILVTHRLNHREGLTFLEECARLLDVPGVPVATQAALFRVLSYYITGAAIDEALGYARGPSATDPVPPEEARRDFPSIMALGEHFGRENHLGLYLAGLDAILDWIEAEITGAQATE